MLNTASANRTERSKQCSLYMEKSVADNSVLDYTGCMQRENSSISSLQVQGITKSELLDNASMPPMGEDKPTNNKTMQTETETKAKRSKTNYDIVMGAILTYVQKNPGSTIPQIHEAFGLSEANPTGHKTPVVYQAIRNLKERGALFGTGAKKNEGLYLTSEDAEANKPVATERPQRKKDQPFTLEKLMPKGNWWAIEGNSDKDAIQTAYDLATTVPGSTFRIVDNTGDAPVVLATNEQPGATAKPKAAKKSKSEKLETVEA